GQIKGMKDVAGLIRDAMLSAPTAVKACIAASDIIHHILNQRVYPHYEDIRRFAGATESEDRRSWGINQYVYGVCLDLTGGKGLYSWDEVKNEIRQVQ
ncbi:hypothetical protein VSS74_31595, partial [Conexibacter stalactiti]|nr:hypothetical protein [Conexibacter stalactiti]MEC5039588.1 hypothetical protein [Conexibacter stalactiti]